MDNIKLIKAIKDKLPLEVLDNKYLRNILKWFLSNFSDAALLVGKIKVSRCIYECLDASVRKYFMVQDDVFLDASFHVNRTNYRCTIKNIDGVYLIEGTEQTATARNSRLYMDCGDFTRMEIEHIDLDGDIVLDYDVKVIYSPMVITDMEAEKDFIFSKRFNVPSENIRLFRTNFARYKNEINMLSKMNDMKDRDDCLSEEERFLFRKPFVLADLRNFISEEFRIEIDALLDKALSKKVDISGSIEINEELLNNVLSGLLAQIGSDGEVVISNNLYQDLIMTFQGKNLFILYARGYIVKRSDNFFTLYYVHITNNQVMVVPKFITNEEAQDLFKLNPRNQEVEGLSAFFGERGRS